MFAVLRRLLFKIRVYLGAIRAGIYGLAVVAATWVLVLPPSADEIDRLRLSQTEGLPSENLRYYRMAKLLLLVGTDSFYERVAAETGGEMTANEIRFGVLMAAEGYPLQEEPVADTPTALRPETSAKFVAARQN